MTYPYTLHSLFETNKTVQIYDDGEPIWLWEYEAFILLRNIRSVTYMWIENKEWYKCHNYSFYKREHNNLLLSSIYDLSIVNWSSL